jgi:hypothetical protein
MDFYEIKKEVDRLFFAWREYMRERRFRNIEDFKKFLSSLGLGLGISLFVGLLFWLVKSSVYAQTKFMPSQPFSFPESLPWIMGGSALGVVFG